MLPSECYANVFVVLGFLGITILLCGCAASKGSLILLACAVIGLAVGVRYYAAGDDAKLKKLAMKNYEWTIDKLEKERETCRKYYDEDQCIIKITRLKNDSLYYKRIIKGEINWLP